MHDPARILIVDDNPTNRDILVTRLAMHGYDLSQAADGEEAVAAVKTLVPDLVLLDHDLGFGVGIAYGYATLGTIGYEGRLQYSVTGKVANVAARLCGEAKDGQILIDINVRSATEAHGEIELIGELNLKGFARPMKAFNVLTLTPLSSSLPTSSASSFS
jgi:class 3 adenylate cyclase